MRVQHHGEPLQCSHHDVEVPDISGRQVHSAVHAIAVLDVQGEAQMIDLLDLPLRVEAVEILSLTGGDRHDVADRDTGLGKRSLGRVPDEVVLVVYME